MLQYKNNLGLENKQQANCCSAQAIYRPDSKGALAQRQIMVGMVGLRRRWAIYVGQSLGKPGVAMRIIRLLLV